MGKKEHRLGVSEINLVVRHLKLAPVDQNNLQAMAKFCCSGNANGSN